jgi:hypothetical protein
LITNFWLGIYDDVPAVTNLPTGQVTPSHPGTNLLWHQTFNQTQYIENPAGTGNEQFWDPSIPGVIGADNQAFYYCFYPTNPFVQGGSLQQPTNYWLAVYAQVYDQGTMYGWKTALTSYHDAAVWGNVSATGFPVGNWQSMTNQQRAPINLAFKLNTTTNPPQVCVDSNGVKYIQGPNLGNGFDLWNNNIAPPNVTDGPWVLADDFICTNTGKISDIHIWGSWLNDVVASNTLTFWLAMYTDMPSNAATPFSQPGSLIWSQCFNPGQYIETLWSPASESFLDPGPPSFVGPDTQAWYYCFYPTNPPTQQGNATAPQTYWLVAFAFSPTGTFGSYGWKTTTNVQHDTSVHAPWPLPTCPPPIPGAVPPLAWTPNKSLTGAPLDLAFSLTTPTNQCIVPITCPVDKTVECGSSWTFDPPFVGPDPCCPVAPTVTLTVVTNSNIPCNQSYSGIWTVIDCGGAVLGVCTQKVSVVDSTPPVLTCATNKLVECGTAWTFDPPGATDACCGTNVIITVFNTVTNVLGPCQFNVTRTWLATDCCTNSTNCSQTVTVVDTTPPSIVCPSNITAFTCTSNVIVTWSIVATDACSSVTITSSPPSGTAFLPNTTNTVIAIAKDVCGNTNHCTFMVTVQRPVLDYLHIRYLATNKIVITWTNGILMSATNLYDTFFDVPSATSPYTNDTLPTPPNNRFYRLRCDSP